MDKEELKKKALNFGKKALDVSKSVAKKVADETDKAVKDWEKKQAENRLLEKRNGFFISKRDFPDLFNDIEKQLRRPLGGQWYSVRPDPDSCEIVAVTSYTERVNSAFPKAERQLTLTINFEPVDFGTNIYYDWHVYEVPPGGFLTNSTIRLTNGWIKQIAEWPAPEETSEDI